MLTDSYLQKILAIYLVISSLLLIFIIPPFQKTDEAAHYLKTMAVATGSYRCQQNEQGVFESRLPQAYVLLPDLLLAEQANGSHTGRFPVGLFNQALAIPKESYSQTAYSSQICNLPLELYLPSAGILASFVYFQISPLIVFFLVGLVF